MARGQAFETMMLVISVIVALAILGVLLNILGFINPTALGSSPRATLTENIRDLNSKGYGLVQPKKITFEQGDTIFVKELVQDLPVVASDVKFFCGTPEICGDADAPLDVQDARISVRKKIEVFVVSCANEQKSNPPRYCNAFSSTSDPAQATDTCIASSACDVN